MFSIAPGNKDHHPALRSCCIRQYLVAQLFVTPLALISRLLVVPASPAILLRDRIIETVIGAAVGIALVLAPTVWRRLRRA